MKKISVAFKPDTTVTDPDDIVDRYKFSASVGGAVIDSQEHAAADATTVEVDPGKAGVDVDFEYSFSDRNGNWTAPAKKTIRVAPDKVPDTTPPPANAGDLDVAVVAETPVAPPSPAPTPDAAPVEPAPVEPAAEVPAEPPAPADEAPAAPAEEPPADPAAPTK